MKNHGILGFLKNWYRLLPLAPARAARRNLNDSGLLGSKTLVVCSAQNSFSFVGPRYMLSRPTCSVDLLRAFPTMNLVKPGMHASQRSRRSRSTRQLTPAQSARPHSPRVRRGALRPPLSSPSARWRRRCGPSVGMAMNNRDHPEQQGSPCLLSSPVSTQLADDLPQME